ncbi:hypothetical protein MRB53_039680 [Persea americana]|nr:hypothetical protein MRB53_039680 [Persea americana]
MRSCWPGRQSDGARRGGEDRDWEQEQRRRGSRAVGDDIGTPPVAGRTRHPPFLPALDRQAVVAGGREGLVHWRNTVCGLAVASVGGACGQWRGPAGRLRSGSPAGVSARSRALVARAEGPADPWHCRRRRPSLISHLPSGRVVTDARMCRGGPATQTGTQTLHRLTDSQTESDGHACRRRARELASGEIVCWAHGSSSRGVYLQNTQHSPSQRPTSGDRSRMVR